MRLGRVVRGTILRQLDRFRKQLKQLDLLILGELGYVPTWKTGAELLFDVLSTAYERQSLIVTVRAMDRRARQ